ncbi:hypothetical protein [Nocardia sp. R6R-6]|uniref:hypothetical protein n=1 Tax=Nocardia sp. R6R-6 TaxID=3459303 RepID=UPI00403DE77C
MANVAPDDLLWHPVLFGSTEPPIRVLTPSNCPQGLARGVDIEARRRRFDDHIHPRGQIRIAEVAIRA